MKFPLKRLAEARKAAGMTQAELAKRLNQEYSKNVSNWEQGIAFPEYETLFKLCEILDCDMDYLFGRIDCTTHDLQFIRDQTGLSEEAIKALQRDEALYGAAAILSRIIVSPKFPELISRIHQLLTMTTPKAAGIVNEDTKLQISQLFPYETVIESISQGLEAAIEEAAAMKVDDSKKQKLIKQLRGVRQAAGFLPDESPRQALGLNSERNVLDIKEDQITHCFTEIIKALEGEALNDGKH